MSLTRLLLALGLGLVQAACGSCGSGGEKAEADAGPASEEFHAAWVDGGPRRPRSAADAAND
jgi:hypothetical protein